MQSGRISGAGTNFSLLSGKRRAADMTTGFATRRIAEAPDAIAPDGSEVRLLGSSRNGSMASFRLQRKPCREPSPIAPSRRSGTSLAEPGACGASSAIAEEIVEVAAGVSITIPTGAHFQFPLRRRRAARGGRRDDAALAGLRGSYAVAGKWQPTV